MRRTYPWLLVSLVCVGCGPGANTPGGGDPKGNASDPQEIERLKGTWHVIAIEAAGKAIPAARVQALNLQYIFDGGKVTVRRPGRGDNTSTFSVDAVASPKKMTINQSPPVRAVYDLNGNTLRLCVMVDENPNAGYPAEMVSRGSPKTDLLSLERR